MARLCDYCKERKSSKGWICVGAMPYEYYGAEVCTGFTPSSPVACSECGRAADGNSIGLLLGRWMCDDCLDLIFGTDDDLAMTYDPEQAELTDLIVELEGRL